MSPERSRLSSAGNPGCHCRVEHARAVDNNALVAKKVPLVCWSSSARFARDNIELITMSRQMNCAPPQPVSIAELLIRFTLMKTHLSREQLECLARCAKGISVRFERWEIVDALIVGGYAEKGVAGTITVTAKGQQYLKTHGS
jgi:hypothetical protein